MKELLQYELYRNKKFYMVLFGLVLIFNLLMLGFLSYLPKVELWESLSKLDVMGFNIEKNIFIIQVLINIGLFITLFDRRSTLLGRDLVFQNKSLMLVIPKKPSHIVSANYMMMIGEVIAFLFIIYWMVLYPYFRNLDTLLWVGGSALLIIALYAIGSVINIMVGQINSELVAGLITGLLIIVIVIALIFIALALSRVVMINYSIKVYYLTWILLLALMGYTFNCRLVDNSPRFIMRSRIWFAVVFLLIGGFFFVGQGITYGNRIIDIVELPFQTDAELIGKWSAIDFVESPMDYNPDDQQWRGKLFLTNMEVLQEGTTNLAFIWTKGLIIHKGDKTAAAYHIEEINGKQYLFMEWKSGDYTFRHSKPWFYVFEKNSGSL